MEKTFTFVKLSKGKYNFVKTEITAQGKLIDPDNEEYLLDNGQTVFFVTAWVDPETDFAYESFEIKGNDDINDLWILDKIFTKMTSVFKINGSDGTVYREMSCYSKDTVIDLNTLTFIGQHNADCDNEDDFGLVDVYADSKGNYYIKTVE